MDAITSAYEDKLGASTQLSCRYVRVEANLAFQATQRLFVRLLSSVSRRVDCARRARD